MMRRMLDYLLLFLVVVVLQVFLFDNLDTGLYLHPMIYMAFILLLPVETVPILVLLLGLATRYGGSADRRRRIEYALGTSRGIHARGGIVAHLLEGQHLGWRNTVGAAFG